MKRNDQTSHLQGWHIVAENPPVEQTQYYESMMTLGNGLLGLRGAREEARIDRDSRPMTLMAEVYDRPKRIAGVPRGYRPMTRLAALPNPLMIDFDDGEGFLSEHRDGVRSERRVLDMKRGVLERTLRYRGPGGRITRIASRRLVSQARPHLVAIRYTLTPENYSGRVTLLSGLDLNACYPDGVDQVREVVRGYSDELCWLQVETVDSRIQVADVVRHSLRRRGRHVAAEVAPAGGSQDVGVTLSFDARRGEATTLEKIVCIHASIREEDPLGLARDEALAAPGFDALSREHADVWADYWADGDVRIRGDRFAQTMVRFWVFQLLQAASMNNVKLGLSASIPAKTLSGWGYGGAIFWDTEVYMLPFFSQQYPAIARSLLQYRHDRLAAAGETARRTGCAGVKFPWESAASGLEECSNWCVLRGVKNGWERWRGGEQEIHINADIPFGFWQNYLATGDRDFLMTAGLDVLVGTARYWASRVKQRTIGGRTVYEICKVIGPDESHQGVDNNLYTNAMARWNLRKAAELVDSLEGGSDAGRAARRRLKIRTDEVGLWQKVADGIRINFDAATGLYEQFDGYFRNPHQTIKQADVLLALYLLPELRPGDVLRRNFERYDPVTEHGSSLSPCMHVLFALEMGDERKAYEYALHACAVDGIFAPGQSDKGLHAASLGGGWSAIVSGFGGVRVTADGLDVSPRLPARWKALAFSLVYRGQRLGFHVGRRSLVIRSSPKGSVVPLCVMGEKMRLRPGCRVERRIVR